MNGIPDSLIIEDQRQALSDLASRLNEAQRCIELARSFLRGEIVNDQAEAWDQCLRVLDGYGADPVVHAQNYDLEVWCGPRSQLPTGYREVCTDAEYKAQGLQALMPVREA